MSDLGFRYRPYLPPEPDGRTRDGRTRDGRRLRAVRRDLVARCRGCPSATQRKLIEVAARLTVFVARLDEKRRGCGRLTADEADAWAAAVHALAVTVDDIEAAAAQPSVLPATSGALA